MVKAKYWGFLTKSYLTKIKPEQKTGRLCHKMTMHCENTIVLA